MTAQEVNTVEVQHTAVIVAATAGQLRDALTSLHAAGVPDDASVKCATVHARGDRPHRLSVAWRTGRPPTDAMPAPRRGRKA